MKPTELNWTNFPWEKFEELIVYLVQDSFHEISAQRYLKQGNRQQGIDIITLQNKSGKYLCIQCKKTSEFGLAELKQAEKKFLDGTYAASSDTFIIATSSDCQKERTQEYFQQQTQNFLINHKITYQLWDINFIETSLKKHYRLVAYYFGIAQARAHCFAPSLAIPKYQKIKDYLPRTLINIKDIDKNPFHRNERHHRTFLEILEEDFFVTKHICLLADAYEGKTSLLCQTAHQLMEVHQSIVPLLVILKDTSLKPIQDILSDHYNAWENIGACNLVVIIDGLDEVATDRFTDAITLIKDFARSYPQVHLIFSCRKLFFFNFHLETELRFEYFQLQPLSHYHIDQFLDRKIGEEKKKLYSRIRQMDLEELIRNPFYLIQLTKWFTSGPQALPSSKIDITEKFIDESLEFSATRRLSGGQLLDANRVAYKKVLQKFALTLQLSGLNAAPKETVQELFNQNERELLQSSSIITTSSNSWSFSNAMFQEQLAARKLLNFPVEQISPMISSGKIFIKINTKWLQTIASYLSLLPSGHQDRNAILEIIRKDNIELLTLADRSKFSPQFRLQVITEIFARSIRDNTRLLLVQHSDVGDFIGNDDSCIRFLISQIKPELSERIKVVACLILKYLQLSPDQQQTLLKAVLKDLPAHIDPYYGGNLLNLIANYRLDSKKLHHEILRKKPRLNKHEFREGIYRYIVATGKIDQHYQLGIQGLEVLVRHNQDINHHGSEAELETFLLSTRSVENLKKLYQLMSTENWLHFYHHKSILVEKYMSDLAKLSSELYLLDHGLMLYIIQFLIQADKTHKLNNFENLFQFFDITKTHHLGIQLYLQQKDGEGYHFNFGKLLSEASEEILIRMHEDAELERKELYHFATAYLREKMPDQAEQFRKLIEQSFGKEPERKTSHDSYSEIEKIKLDNDQLHLISLENFERALRVFFGYYKNNSLNSAQLNADPIKKTKRTPLESNHILAFVRKCQDEYKIVRLKDCLETLNTPLLFETWRAYRLKDINEPDALNTEYQQILENFYYSQLPITRFKDSLGHPSDETWYRKSVLLAEIWRKFKYPTLDDYILEFTWVISGGINALSTARANRKTSIAEALLDHFKQDPEILAAKIISNLQHGITHPSVETAHLELCKVLLERRVIPILLDKINRNQDKTSDISRMISIYNKLGGDPGQLISYFKRLRPYENYIYTELAKVIIDPYPEIVIPGLKKVLKSDHYSQENQISAAIYLAQAGDITGFNYLIDLILISKKPPLEIQSKFKIWNIDTKKALKKLDQVIHMVLDTGFHCEPFYRSPDRLILEILNGLASKSEQDLQLVYAYFHKNAKKFRTQFPETASNLIWYGEVAMENFRKQNNNAPDIYQIKDLLERYP